MLTQHPALAAATTGPFGVPEKPERQHGSTRPAKLAIVCSTLFALLFGGSAVADERPNILFIFSDDQNYKTLSCDPESPDWVNTPNIDALAKEGVRFRRAYFGAWCMPSRASFLTGRLQHGIQSMRMEGKYPGSVYDPQECRFWPGELRKNGYHTAQIGKWHTGVDTGNGRDWDHQIVWSRPGHPENAGNYFYDQIVTFNGVDREVKGYSTDNYTNWAVDYIKGKNRDKAKPWYLWLCYGAIHGPTTPADRHESKLAGNKAPVPEDIYGPWPNKPAYLQKIKAWKKGEDGKPYRKKRKLSATNFNSNDAGQNYDDWVQQYNECEMAVDEGVGRLMQTLKETGQLENTIIVYAADQGLALGQHGMNNKVAAYDAAVASPIIISHAGKVPRGKVCSHPINAPDVVRYFADAAKIKIPWRTDGRDISTLISNPETKDWDSPMLMTHTGRKYGSDTDRMPDEIGLYEVGGIPWYVLLRDGKYKYIRTLVEGEIEEIYDLNADPEELKNLAVDAAHRQLLEKLRRRAEKELRRTHAKFIDHMPKPGTLQRQAGSTGDRDLAIPLAKKEELKYSDDFERSDIAPWKQIIRGLQIKDGVLVQTRDRPDHGSVARLEKPLQDQVMKDVILSFRFRMEDSIGFNACFNDRKFKGSHAGHICRVMFRKNSITLSDGKEGVFKHEIRAMKGDPSKAAERTRLLKGRTSKVNYKFKPQQWYTTTIEIVGDEMRVSLNNKPVGYLKSPGIGHPTKGNFSLTGAGKENHYDDMKVWAVQQR